MDPSTLVAAIPLLFEGVGSRSVTHLSKTGSFLSIISVSSYELSGLPQLHIFSHLPPRKAAWCIEVGVGVWVVHRFVTGLYDSTTLSDRSFTTIAEFLSSEVKPPITYIPPSNLER
jgi:hypothetical protein